jgi:hypothetical protein
MQSAGPALKCYTGKLKYTARGSWKYQWWSVVGCYTHANNVLIYALQRPQTIAELHFIPKFRERSGIFSVQLQPARNVETLCLPD